ncbi:MAG: MFS transporter [Sinobacteraceae bacterium]|nr:MFS transporter [Nevskiaceae bacterium]
MTPATASANDPVAVVIDEAPIGRLHWRIFLICAAIMSLDGFDLGLLGFVVPAMAADWALPPSSFAFALSASLIGVAFGSTIAGWMGDRLGRRTALLWMFVIGAAGSLLTALCADLASLSICRFITGFGMGGAIPNVIALVTEFAPRRRRSFLVVMVYSMAALGSTGASVIAGPFIANWGWQSMFIVGGVLPLIVGVAAFFKLPESIKFLIASGRKPSAAADLLQRLSGRAAGDPVLERALRVPLPDMAESPAASSSSRLLFAGWLRWGTPLLWVAFIGTQALVFFNSSWMPTLLREAGFSLQVAIQATGLFHFGSVFGGLVTSWLAARYPLSRLLALLYLLATLSLLTLGAEVSSVTAAYILAFCVGFGVVGASFCLGAFASSCYADTVRARGVGWGLGIGRVGSISSPLLGGAALAAGYTVDSIISTLAIPAAVCCFVMLLIARLQPTARKN